LQTRVCDVSKAASRKSLLEWLASGFPALNILVNNAGIQCAIDFRTGRNLPQVDAELSTNLAGPIHLSALLIPLLRKQKHSAIVNISSGLAFTPLAAVPVYCATKAAIHAFTLSLRHQLRNTSVRVFEAAPPIVRTELAGRRSRPEGDFVMRRWKTIHMKLHWAPQPTCASSARRCSPPSMSRDLTCWRGMVLL